MARESAVSTGRPPATSHGAIERAAFTLFEERGFEETTMDDIARVVGVGRRTLFRYYPSKNDILWGQFDDGLRSFAEMFRRTPPDVSIPEAIREALIAFNRLDEAAVPQHRQRMRLLLGTPALLAHSELRYAAWRDVVAAFVGERLGVPADGLLPRLAGRVALAAALVAYEEWLADDERSLPDLLRETSGGLTQLFGSVRDGSTRARPSEGSRQGDARKSRRRRVTSTGNSSTKK